VESCSNVVGGCGGVVAVVVAVDDDDDDDDATYISQNDHLNMPIKRINYITVVDISRICILLTQCMFLKM